MSTLSAWLLSIPTLIIILFCMQDFDGIVAATYSNNWAEYLVQTIGPKGAVAILSLLWVDSTCATASCFLSAQRVTFAISRDGVLPFSKYFRQLSRNKIPVNAAFLVCGLSIAITTAVIGSVVAFSAITATVSTRRSPDRTDGNADVESQATIATNFSYLIPIFARHTVGRNRFKPAEWNLGGWTLLLGIISGLYIMFLFIVLLLPQLYPVTAVSEKLCASEIDADDVHRRRSTTLPSVLASLRSSAWSGGSCRSDWAVCTGSKAPSGRLRTKTRRRAALLCRTRWHMVISNCVLCRWVLSERRARSLSTPCCLNGTTECLGKHGLT